MSIKIYCLLILLLSSALFVGCEFPPDYVQLMKLPNKERHEEFRKLPLEKQVDFYLLRVSFSHPPDSSFAEDIAIRGEDALPYLLERLQKEPEDFRKEHIILVFREIHLNTVDLRYKKDVLSNLEGAVEQMKDAEWKKMAQGSVNFIKEFAPKYAADYKALPSLTEPPPLPPPPPTPTASPIR